MLAQALAAEQADLNLSLIQPASMLGRVMHGKARPQPSARLLAESVHQCFAGVGAQVVQNQMDGIGAGVVLGNLQDENRRQRWTTPESGATAARARAFARSRGVTASQPQP